MPLACSLSLGKLLGVCTAGEGRLARAQIYFRLAKSVASGATAMRSSRPLSAEGQRTVICSNTPLPAFPKANANVFRGTESISRTNWPILADRWTP